MSPAPVFQIRNYDPALLHAWGQGVAEFNAGKFWHAHEEWERGWKTLPEPERSWVQGWIQLSGAIFLFQKGRKTPARSLCLRALFKLEQSKKMAAILPRIEVEGGAAFLRQDEVSQSDPNGWKHLKAKLLSGPGL